ncbi:MAG: hypothetical protein ACRDFB_02005 [Rhabdochlamydiaceae bacterium]
MANVGAVDPIFSIQAPPKILGDSAFESTKPILPRMIALHTSLGKTGDRTSHNILDRLEHERNGLQVWSKQEMDHLLAVANRTWMEQGWSALKTVADCVISVVSFAMGGYLLAHGNTTAGNFLIVSGVFNILQAVFARQGMWDWISKTLEEKNEAHRDRLKKIFPVIVSVLSIAFSIAGSRFASTLQPIDLINRLENVKNFISMAGKGVSSYFSIKKGFDDAHLPEIQGELKKHELSIDLLSRFLETTIKECRRIKSMIKKPINALMQVTTLASQKV